MSTGYHEIFTSQKSTKENFPISLQLVILILQNSYFYSKKRDIVLHTSTASAFFEKN